MSPAPAFASRFEFAHGTRTAVLTLRGHLTPDAVEELEAQLADVYAAGARRFVFDLGRLTHIGSVGLRVFVAVHRKVQGDGAVVLCRLTPAVRAVFELTRLTKFFHHYPTLAEALDAVNT